MVKPRIPPSLQPPKLATTIGQKQTSQIIVQKKILSKEEKNLREVKSTIKSTQDEIDKLMKVILQKSKEAQFISNVKKQKVGGTLRAEIRNTGREIDMLKRRILALKASQNVGEGMRRASMGEASIRSQAVNKQIIIKEKQKGGFIYNGVLFNKEGNIISALDNQGIKSIQSIQPILKRQAELKDTNKINQNIEDLKTFSPKPRPIPTPTVTARPPPKNIFEQFKQDFSFFGGSIKTNLQTKRKVSVPDQIEFIPITAPRFIGTRMGQSGRRVSEKFIPEGGFKINVPAKNITYVEPQFGTLTNESSNGLFTQTIEVPNKTKRIFDPKRIEQGVSFGTQLAIWKRIPGEFLSPGFISEGVRTAGDESLTTGQRVLGAIEVGSGVMIGGRALQEDFFNPIITTTPGKIKKPVTVEVQATGTSASGTPQDFGTFFRATQTKPSSVTTRTTPFKEFFGMKPKVIKRTPEEITIQTTPQIVPLTEKPQAFTIFEQKLGGKSIKVIDAITTSRKTPLNQKNIQLGDTFTSKIESQLLRNLPSKSSRVFTGKENIRTTLSLAQDTRRLTPTKRTLRDKPLRDKPIRLSASVSEGEKVLESELAELFKVTSVSKEIKSLSPRANAQTQNTISTLIKLKGSPKADIPHGNPLFSGFTKTTKGKPTRTVEVKESVNLISSSVKAPRTTTAPQVSTLIDGGQPSNIYGNVAPTFKQGSRTRDKTINTQQEDSQRIFGVQTIQRSKQSTKTATRQKEKQANTQFLFGGKRTVQQTATGTKEDIKQEFRKGTIIKLGDKSKPDTTTQTNITFGGNNKPPKPPIRELPKKPKVPVGIILFPGETVPRASENVGYHTEVLERGKWKRVTTGLYNREGALDVGARITDNTTAAQFRIKSEKVDIKQSPKKRSGINNIISMVTGAVGQNSSTKKTPSLKKGDGYFLMNRQKFRDYTKQRGQKRKISNRYIEKKNKRIDTFGEASGLTVAQSVARRKRNQRFRL